MALEAVEPDTENPHPGKGAGTLLSVTRNQLRTQLSPFLRALPQSLGFFFLFKICDMGTFQCYQQRFQLQRWKQVSGWLLVGGYLLLAPSLSIFAICHTG